MLVVENEFRQNKIVRIIFQHSAKQEKTGKGHPNDQITDTHYTNFCI